MLFDENVFAEAILDEELGNDVKWKRRFQLLLELSDAQEDLVYFVSSNSRPDVTIKRLSTASKGVSDCVAWMATFYLNLISKLNFKIKITVCSSDLKVQSVRLQSAFASTITPMKIPPPKTVKSL